MSVLPIHSGPPSPTTSHSSSSPNELTPTLSTTTDSSHTFESHYISSPSGVSMGKFTWSRRLELIGAVLVSSKYGRMILTFFGLLLAGMVFYPTATEPIVYSTDATFTVLPLGDSITWGYGSQDNNGYRRRLSELVPELEYIGTQRSGNMTHPFTEAFPGARIHDIAMRGREGLSMAPDIILLNIGINDFQNRLDEYTTPKKMEALFEDLEFICPEALVIVGTVTPHKNPIILAYIKAFNRQLPAMVKARQDAGKRILLVDHFAAVEGLVPFDDFHPADAGCDKMGDMWYWGLEQAVKRGWI